MNSKSAAQVRNYFFNTANSLMDSRTDLEFDNIINQVNDPTRTFFMVKASVLLNLSDKRFTELCNALTKSRLKQFVFNNVDMTTNPMHEIKLMLLLEDRPDLCIISSAHFSLNLQQRIDHNQRLNNWIENTDNKIEIDESVTQTFRELKQKSGWSASLRGADESMIANFLIHLLEKKRIVIPEVLKLLDRDVPAVQKAKVQYITYFYENYHHTMSARSLIHVIIPYYCNGSRRAFQFDQHHAQFAFTILAMIFKKELRTSPVEMFEDIHSLLNQLKEYLIEDGDEVVQVMNSLCGYWSELNKSVINISQNLNQLRKNFDLHTLLFYWVCLHNNKNIVDSFQDGFDNLLLQHVKLTPNPTKINNVERNIILKWLYLQKKSFFNQKDSISSLENLVSNKQEINKAFNENPEDGLISDWALTNCLR